MRYFPAIHLAIVSTLGAWLMAPVAVAGSCPPALDQATRLAIVSAPTMKSVRASVRRYERADPASSWKPQGSAQPVVVGAQGLAWGHPFAAHAYDAEPLKREGDQRTPLGIYRLGATFGFAKNDRPNYLRLTPGANVCVHDTRSPLYGRIVPRSTVGKKVDGEEMSKIPTYKRGIVIDYPPDAAAKAGSCIFVHIWESEDVGTAGCVALPEAEVATLQEWTKGRRAAIAIVSAETVARFGDCLPLTNLSEGTPAPR
jgi:L,D-peptidoglycan transpeptidase YkuD (ErfK/YbiS/YcfS/YnhG family)